MLNLNQIQTVQESIQTFGHFAQISHAIEEFAELTVAIMHYRRKRIKSDAVCEEIADALIMIECLRQLNEMELFMEIKINPTSKMTVYLQAQIYHENAVISALAELTANLTNAHYLHIEGPVRDAYFLTMMLTQLYGVKEVETFVESKINRLAERIEARKLDKELIVETFKKRQHERDNG
jgi:NTP pyrophosphatase (non-canonical NTP hydrolase)